VTADQPPLALLAWLRTQPELSDNDLAEVLALATPITADDSRSGSLAYPLALACITHPAAGTRTLAAVAAYRAWR
jgi:hypothetical protein